MCFSTSLGRVIVRPGAGGHLCARAIGLGERRSRKKKAVQRRGKRCGRTRAILGHGKGGTKVVTNLLQCNAVGKTGGRRKFKEGHWTIPEAAGETDAKQNNRMNSGSMNKKERGERRTNERKKKTKGASIKCAIKIEKTREEIRDIGSTRLHGGRRRRVVCLKIQGGLRLRQWDGRGRI